MVTLDLEDENIVENAKCVRILQSLGMPDDEIQEYYDRSKRVGKGEQHETLRCTDEDE